MLATGITALATDLQAIWSAPTTDARLKKRIVCTVIQEEVADVDDKASEIELLIHWIGGGHTELRLPKRRRGQRNSTSGDIIAAIRQLAGDDLIAGILNRNGLVTGHGHGSGSPHTDRITRSRSSDRHHAAALEGWPVRPACQISARQPQTWKRPSATRSAAFSLMPDIAVTTPQTATSSGSSPLARSAASHVPSNPRCAADRRSNPSSAISRTSIAWPKLPRGPARRRHQCHPGRRWLQLLASAQLVQVSFGLSPRHLPVPPKTTPGLSRLIVHGRLDSVPSSLASDSALSPPTPLSSDGPQ